MCSCHRKEKLGEEKVMVKGRREKCYNSQTSQSFFAGWRAGLNFLLWSLSPSCTRADFVRCHRDHITVVRGDRQAAQRDTLSNRLETMWGRSGRNLLATGTWVCTGGDSESLLCSGKWARAHSGGSHLWGPSHLLIPIKEWLNTPDVFSSLSRWALRTQAPSFPWGPKRRGQSHLPQNLSLDMADHSLSGALSSRLLKPFFLPCFPPTQFLLPLLIVSVFLEKVNDLRDELHGPPLSSLFSLSLGDHRRRITSPPIVTGESHTVLPRLLFPRLGLALQTKHGSS